MNIEQKTITSIEVAEMMEIRHGEVLRKLDGDKSVKGIIPTLTEHNFVLSDYFQESTYTDASGKENKCYLITKLGCDFLANKFTGEKGILFTAKYVKRFHEMQETIKTGIVETENLSPELKMFQSIFNAVAKNELETKQALENSRQALDKVESIKEIVALNPNDWRKESSNLINKMAQNAGGYEHIKVIREDAYKYLEQRYGVALGVRLTNKKKTMALNGASKSALDKVNKLDVIAEDKKLIEGYTSIIKEMAIKYGVA